MRLACDDSGSGPVVVFLHGFPFDHTMWEHQQTALWGRYRVLAPDLRGHGRSPVADGPSTIDAMADDVLETLGALSIGGPVVIAGLSMGGYVALSLAAHHSDRLRGLMLLDTRAGADAPDVARGREGTARTVERTGDITGLVDGMLPRLFSPVSRERRPEIIARMREQMLRTPPAGVAAALRALGSRPDRTPMLSSIAVPTLVLCGADDVISPPTEMRQLAEAIPDARFVTVPEAGHLASLENPAPVNAAIAEFLESLEGPARG